MMRFLWRAALLFCAVWLSAAGTAQANVSCRQWVDFKQFAAVARGVSEQDLRGWVEKYAKRYGVAPQYCWGVLRKESGGDVLACKYERNYRHLHRPQSAKPGSCALSVEIAQQKMSLGVMQVMGAVFREQGYVGRLSALFGEPEKQVEYGCRVLAEKIAKYGVRRGISAYNAGTPSTANRRYVAEVLKHAREW